MKEEVITAQRPLPAPRPWFQSAKFLALLFVLLVIYAYGWRVTKIDIPALATGTKFAKPFVVDLARPDILSRDFQTQEVQLGMSVQPGVEPEEVAPPSGGPQIQVSTRVVPIGSKLVVTGTGFRPNTDGSLDWVSRIGNPAFVGSFRTDVEGNFTATITVPELFRGPEPGP